MPRKPQIQLQAESKTPFLSKTIYQVIASPGTRLAAAGLVGGGKMLHQRTFSRVMQLPGTHLSWRGSETKNTFVSCQQESTFLTSLLWGWICSTQNTCVGLFSKHVDDQLLYNGFSLWVWAHTCWTQRYLHVRKRVYKWYRASWHGKKGFKSVRFGNNGTRDCEVLVEHPGQENKGTCEVKVLVCQHVSWPELDFCLTFGQEGIELELHTCPIEKDCLQKCRIKCTLLLASAIKKSTKYPAHWKTEFPMMISSLLPLMLVKCLQLNNEEQFDPKSFVTRFQICSGSLEFEEKCLLVKI